MQRETIRIDETATGRLDRLLVLAPRCKDRTSVHRIDGTGAKGGDRRDAHSYEEAVAGLRAFVLPERLVEVLNQM